MVECPSERILEKKKKKKEEKKHRHLKHVYKHFFGTQEIGLVVAKVSIEEVYV